MTDARKLSYQLLNVGNAISDNGAQDVNGNTQQSPSSLNQDYSSVIDTSLTNPSLEDSAVAAHIIAQTKASSKLPPLQDKKHLHIRSEQRRRERITDGFSQLRAVVPTITSGQDSKAAVLKKSAEYIEALEYEVNSLKSQLIAVEQYYKNNSNFNNSNNNDEENGSEDNEKLDKDGDKKRTRDGQKNLKRKSEDSNNMFSGSNSPAVYPPPPHFAAQFGPPVYPFMAPIIGTPLHPSQIMGVNQGLPHPGQPSPALMHPTVPYYFAEDFNNKKAKKEGSKESSAAPDGNLEGKLENKESGKGTKSVEDKHNAQDIQEIDGDPKKLSLEQADTSNVNGNTPDVDNDIDVEEVANAFAVAVASNHLKQATEKD